MMIECILFTENSIVGSLATLRSGKFHSSTASRSATPSKNASKTYFDSSCHVRFPHAQPVPQVAGRLSAPGRYGHPRSTTRRPTRRNSRKATNHPPPPPPAPKRGPATPLTATVAGRLSAPGRYGHRRSTTRRPTRRDSRKTTNRPPPPPPAPNRGPATPFTHPALHSDNSPATSQTSNALPIRRALHAPPRPDSARSNR